MPVAAAYGRAPPLLNLHFSQCHGPAKAPLEGGMSPGRSARLYICLTFEFQIAKIYLDYFIYNLPPRYNKSKSSGKDINNEASFELLVIKCRYLIV